MIPTDLSDYTGAFIRLLPQGELWPHIEDYNGNNFIKLIAGMSDELQRVDEDVKKELLDGVFPDGSTHISEWEKVLGLPLGTADQTDNERINTIITFFNLPQESNAAFFYLLAELIGFQVFITEGLASEFFTVGIDDAGTRLTNGTGVFTFTVTITAKPADESVETLKSVINFFKPAHTRSIFINNT